MLQYEMAYDPDIKNIPYNDIQLSWHLNYIDVATFSLSGNMEGTLKGTIGASSSSQSSNTLSSLSGIGTKAGTAALAFAGTQWIDKYAVDKPETGEPNNTLGISNTSFSSVQKGLSSALSNAVGGIPGAVIGLLNGIFFGNNNQPVPISLTLNTTIKMEGFATTQGSFPSMPISFWVPGTNISSSAVGYIPLYDKTLGVISFREKPSATIYSASTYDWEGLPNRSYTTYNPPRSGQKKYIEINPEVLKIADVEIIDEQIIVQYLGERTGPLPQEWQSIESASDMYLQFTIAVKPKDGSDPHTIVKTFRMNTTKIHIPSVYYGPELMDWREGQWLFEYPISSIEHDYGYCQICGSFYNSKYGCDPEAHRNLHYYPAGMSFRWQLSKERSFRCTVCGIGQIDNFIMPEEWEGPKPRIIDYFFP